MKTQNEGMLKHFFIDIKNENKEEIEKCLIGVNTADIKTAFPLIVKELYKKKQEKIIEDHQSPNNRKIEPSTKIEQKQIAINCNYHGFNKTAAFLYTMRLLLDLPKTRIFNVKLNVGQGRHSKAKPTIPKRVNDAIKFLELQQYQIKNQNQGIIELKLDRSESKK